MKKKLFLLTALILSFAIFAISTNSKSNKNIIEEDKNEDGLISVLVDGVEQSAFPSKGSAEYQSTSCTNGETAVWDEANWKLSIQDISASTRCVVSFVTGGHNVYVTVSGGSVDNAPKNVPHNGNVTFNVASSNSNYVFSSVKCSGANSYTWANNILSVNGVTADAHCEVVFSRPTYTVYFNVEGGYTEANYLTVVRGGGNSTTFGAVPGYLVSGSRITCDPGITGKISGDRIVISNVQSSGDCQITCAKDSSNYLPGGAVYNIGDEVSYANLAWLVVKDDPEKVTLILKGNAIYSSTASSNPTGTGIFGSGVTYTSSSARSYLVDIWLEQDAQKYLRNAINSEGLEYQNDANGFIRLPYAAEVSKKIPNASDTNFWTMDNDGENHVYYGQPNGYLSEGKSTTDNKYYYEYYTLASNTSAVYKNVPNGSATSTQYFSTTCFARNQETGSASTADHCDSHNDDYATYCASSGPTSIQLCGSYSGQYWYVSCAGQVKVGSYTPSTYCTNTCSNSVSGTWAQITINPFSGTNAYTAGAYSNGYKKWVGNVGTETKSNTGTLETVLNYSNTTTGNSGMTTGVQAVSPSASSARINDTVPKAVDISDVPNNAGTLNFAKVRYQGYKASTAVDSSCDSLKKSSTNSFTNGRATNFYKRYTLQPYNSADMGYRPVIVVYKAN